ncbi:hypothetical protein [Roseomonas rosulenta]|uniref:hypothetical protein n=1 Tax=Roseomonas rosulenta TaxID=2748667 RepID=UPI0018DFF229|nr:hypothetical protein [Roseomonas rosulenta]
MNGPCRLSLLAALMSAPPALANEYARFESVVVVPATRPGEAAGCASRALLNLPPAWRAGDAAVVMLAPWRTPDPARDRLVAALLFEEAAVLELSIEPCPAAETPEAVDPVPEAFGALSALRRFSGAGLVVAIGYGAVARRILDTVADHEAGGRLGSDGPRFAAAAAFDGGAPAFALGAAQPPRERSPVRLGMLCDALGSVAGEVAEGLRGGPESVAAACRVAFGVPMPSHASARRE